MVNSWKRGKFRNRGNFGVFRCFVFFAKITQREENLYAFMKPIVFFKSIAKNTPTGNALPTFSQNFPKRK